MKKQTNSSTCGKVDVLTLAKHHLLPHSWLAWGQGVLSIVFVFFFFSLLRVPLTLDASCSFSLSPSLALAFLLDVDIVVQ